LKHLTKDELVSLLGVAGENDRLMFLLSVNHGLRVSEVIGLTAENFVDGHLVLQRLKGSCKTIQRLLPNEATLLAEHKPAPDGRLFPISRCTAWRRIKAIGAQAGIESFKCHPHVFKHTCATLGLKGGMTLPEVQARLGHKSGASTMMYLAVDDDTASEAFARAISSL
jgi:integrase